MIQAINFLPFVPPVSKTVRTDIIVFTKMDITLLSDKIALIDHQLNFLIIQPPELTPRLPQSHGMQKRYKREETPILLPGEASRDSLIQLRIGLKIMLMAQFVAPKERRSFAATKFHPTAQLLITCELL